MPLLPILWANPLHKWPLVIAFFVRCEFLPRLLQRQPKEVRAVEQVVATTRPGHPEEVLRALDAFGHQEFLMNIGDEKGPILTAVIEEHQPRVVLELGGYLGYSAIDIARKLPPDSHLISVEMSPLNAALATKLIEWAGLQDKVTVVIGMSDKIIPTLRYRFGVDTLDVVLLDHWKDAYLPDLQLLEQEGLLEPGKSWVVADNVLFPGCPDYLAYVTATPPGEEADTSTPAGGGRREVERRRRFYYRTELHEATVEYNPHIKDLVTVSTPDAALN